MNKAVAKFQFLHPNPKSLKTRLNVCRKKGPVEGCAVDVGEDEVTDPDCDVTEVLDCGDGAVDELFVA